MKRSRARMPWYAWFSLFGLVILFGEARAEEERIRRERRKEKRPATDEEFNRYLGFVGRFWGLMLGFIILPCWLVLWRTDLIWEEHPVLANCFFFLYLYPMGIFVTNHLYQYYFGQRKK